MAKTPAKRTKAPASKPAKKSTAAAAKKSTSAAARKSTGAKPKKTTTPVAKKTTRAKPKKATSAAAGKTTAARRKTAVDRTADLSDDVLKSVESGQRAAIEAVRKFVDTVDEAIPAIGNRSSGRETVIDAALEMADKLVGTQYDFLRSVVRSAETSLQPGGKKKK